MKSNGDSYTNNEIKNNRTKIVIDRTLGVYVVCIGSVEGDGAWAADLAAKKIIKTIYDNRQWIKQCNDDPNDEKTRLNLNSIILNTIKECSNRIYHESILDESKKKAGSSTSFDLILTLTNYVTIFHAGKTQIFELSNNRDCLQNKISESVATHNIGREPSSPVNFIPTKLTGGETFIVCSENFKSVLAIKESAIKKSKAFLDSASPYEISEVYVNHAIYNGMINEIAALVVKVAEKRNREAQRDFDLEMRVLRDLPICRHIKHDDECMKQLYSVTRRESFPQNHVLHKENSDYSEFFVLIKGKVEGRKNGTKVAEVSEGESFAEMAFFNKKLRKLQSVAATSVEVLVINRDSLYKLFLENIMLELALYKGALESVSKKHENATERILKLESKLHNLEENLRLAFKK